MHEYDGPQYVRPWDDTETADLVYSIYQDVAYLDHRAQILRDAGIVAAIFTMILSLATNFMPTLYSKHQRLCFFLLALPMYIMPGLVGQLVYQKSLPFEVQLLKEGYGAKGMGKGLFYIGYCSFQSILIGLGNGAPTSFALIHEFKVISLAGLLAFILLG